MQSLNMNIQPFVFSVSNPTDGWHNTISSCKNIQNILSTIDTGLHLISYFSKCMYEHEKKYLYVCINVIH